MNNKLLEWGKEPSKEDKGKFIAVIVKNAKEVHDWYSNQGLELVPNGELHCTIAYSKKDFEYKLSKEDVHVSEFNKQLEYLGKDGAIVLKIYSQELQDRFNRCLLTGATFDYPSYTPHITLSYAEVDDITKFIQPDFNIILGDEYANELIDDYKEKLAENSIKDKE